MDSSSDHAVAASANEESCRRILDKIRVQIERLIHEIFCRRGKSRLNARQRQRKRPLIRVRTSLGGRNRRGGIRQEPESALNNAAANLSAGRGRRLFHFAVLYQLSRVSTRRGGKRAPLRQKALVVIPEPLIVPSNHFLQIFATYSLPLFEDDLFLTNSWIRNPFNPKAHPERCFLRLSAPSPV